MRAHLPGLWLTLLAAIVAAPFLAAHHRHGTLVAAIRRGNLPQIKALLGEDGDVNVQSKNRSTPLMIAADAGDTTYVRALLARGAEVNAQNNASHSALYWAA